MIGRQVDTAFGGRIDLLTIGAGGALSIVEMKRHKTPRDIVAQVLDYASWVSWLDTPTVFAIADRYWQRKGTHFAAAFTKRFGTEPPELIPRLEALRDQWFDAPDDASRQALCADIQQVALDEVAFVPVGAHLVPTALRRNLVDRVPGFLIFWGLRTG